MGLHENRYGVGFLRTIANGAMYTSVMLLLGGVAAIPGGIAGAALDNFDPDLTNGYGLVTGATLTGAIGVFWVNGLAISELGRYMTMDKRT